MFDEICSPMKDAMNEKCEKKKSDSIVKLNALKGRPFGQNYDRTKLHQYISYPCEDITHATLQFLKDNDAFCFVYLQRLSGKYSTWHWKSLLRESFWKMEVITYWV